MTLDRRFLLTAGLGMTASAAAALAGPRKAQAPATPAAAKSPSPKTQAARPAAAAASSGTGLVPDLPADQSRALQALIDSAAERRVPLVLPPGRFRVGQIVLRSGTRLIGTNGGTILDYIGGPAFLSAANADGLAIADIVIDGASLALDAERSDGLLRLDDCPGLAIRNVAFRNGLINGLSLKGCSGAVTDCTFETFSQAAIRSLDGAGLEILHNRIARCGNNGIQVWRETAGEDGTIIAMNRIDGVESKAGGTGENGNGISVFRAGGVIVSGNRITRCAYSAIRGNSASNILMTGNSCAHLGEVALYAEFAFEGAVISSNIVEDAASGIEVTNFNDGGRLAIVQGNLLRRLRRREKEAVDTRGDGIGVEADCVVTGNVIEDAPNAGIVVGWGQFMRNCQVSQNLVRNARYGILVTSDPGAGACLVATNMFSGIKEGAIRLMDHGVPQGADLALKAPAPGRLTITGNMVA